MRALPLVAAAYALAAYSTYSYRLYIKAKLHF